MMTNFTLAKTAAVGSTTTKVVTKTSPDGIGYKKKVVKRHVNHRGNVVMKKKVYRDGMSGSSVTRSRTIHPGAGSTTTTRTIVR